MKIINFTVKGQSIELKTDTHQFQVTSDTLNYFKCKFEFDSAWDGCEIRAYFKNASYNITKSAILDDSGYCYIPWEVLAHTGVLLCNITGVRYSGDEVYRITAGPVKFFLHNSGSKEQLIKKSTKSDVDPLEVFILKEEGTLKPDYQKNPTLTEFEQFMKEIKKTENTIRDMTVSAVSIPPGLDPTVTKTEINNILNLEFGFPETEVIIDQVLSLNSINPVQNKVITEALNNVEVQSLTNSEIEEMLL